MTGPTRRRGSESPAIDPHKIVRLYVAEGLSATALAERFRISSSRIAEILVAHGVTLRNTRQRAKQAADKAWT